MANSSPFKVRGKELRFDREKKKKRRRGASASIPKTVKIIPYWHDPVGGHRMENN